MATTFIEYNGDGNNNKAFSFPSYQVSDVKVQVDDVLKTVTTHYNITNYTTTGGGTVVFTSDNIPAAGTLIRIYRDTAVDAAKATYTAGASVKAGDLNNNHLQLLYALQEEQNQLITTTRIRDEAVTRAKIAADAIDGTKIANDVIDSEHYVADSIDTEHYAPNSVDTTALAADAVTGAQIADDSINSEHYVDGSIDNQHIANTTITGGKLANDTITATQIAADAVGASELADNSVASANIINDSIVDADINSSAAVGLSKLATGALPTGITVASANIVNGTIVAADIANDTITATQVAANTLTAAELAADSVGASELANDAVDTNAVQNDAITKGKISEARLKTLADIPAGTASILAGDALTATTTELNQLDGKSIITSISGSSTDNQLPTGKAVNDQILAVTNALGGFVAIGNETSFPATNPDPSDGAGTIVSIGDAGGVSVNSSGVASITNGAGSGNTVTINGFPASLRGGAGSNSNPHVLAAGLGLQVQTTSTLHTYDYHKLMSDETGVTNAQSAVTDFNERYRVASSAPGDSLHNGDLWFNTTSNSEKMMVYNATNSSWEQVTSIGSFYINTISSLGNSGDTIPGGSATFNGTAKKFTLSHPPSGGAQQLLVSINGVVQKPNSGSGLPTEGFSINGSAIQFATAPAADVHTNNAWFIITIGATVDVGAPSDNTVSSNKIQNRAVTSDKIENNVQLDGTGSVQIPAGTTAQRSGSPANGMLRYNTTTSAYEGYSSSTWGALGGGATGPAGDKDFIYLNDNSLNAAFTIPADQNGMTAGPITIGNSGSVATPSGQSWHIIA